MQIPASKQGAGVTLCQEKSKSSQLMQALPPAATSAQWQTFMEYHQVYDGCKNDVEVRS